MVRGGPDGPTPPSARRRPGPACTQTRSNGPGVHTISKRVHGPIYELGFSRLRAHDFETRARATKHAFAKACICRATPKTSRAAPITTRVPEGGSPFQSPADGMFVRRRYSRSSNARMESHSGT